MNLYELINEIGSSRPDSQGHLFTLHNADRVENSDGHYSNQLTIIKDRVFPSYHDAVDWIEQRASKEFSMTMPCCSGTFPKMQLRLL